METHRILTVSTGTSVVRVVQVPTEIRDKSTGPLQTGLARRRAERGELVWLTSNDQTTDEKEFEYTYLYIPR